MVTYEEYLRCILTERERNDIGSALARAASTRAEIEQRKKQVDASLKADIEQETSTITTLAQKLNNGYEYRNVECTVLLNSPKEGQKTVVRTDTGEEVKIVAMTATDNQMALIDPDDLDKGAPIAAATTMGGTHQKRGKK